MKSLMGMLPFNIALLTLTPEMLRGVQQVKVLDIFAPSTKNFHPEGLYSTEIFGKVGDELRNRRYGYIDLGVEIFHPLIFKKLVDLKELYGKIMAGTAYAVFNKQSKDFEESNPVDGKTGFSFFLSHFAELRFEERPSTSRAFAIKLVDKYRQKALMRHLLVMPAGLRDFTIKPSGQPEEDDINTLYRQALSIGNIAISSSVNGDKEHLDSLRYRLQQTVFSLYQYIINLLEGDSKLIQGHWTSRNVFNTTRNVITSSVSKSQKLFDDLTLGPNDLVVGLYQHLRSIFPIFTKLIREYSERVFTGPNSPALLVNKKTLKQEQVQVDALFYDEWFTQEGIEGLLNHFETPELRSEVIEISGYYFGLIYRDGKVFKFLQDIDEVPEGFDKKNVRPITYVELFYMAIFEYCKRCYCLTTRYPVINLGGIFPASVYLKTTTDSECLTKLDEQWQPTEIVYNEFPIIGKSFFNSISIPIVHLGRAGADHDGDMMNYIVPMTEDSVEEIETLLKSANYYVGVDKKMNFSADNDVSSLVFKELSM